MLKALLISLALAPVLTLAQQAVKINVNDVWADHRSYDAATLWDPATAVPDSTDNGWKAIRVHPAADSITLQWAEMPELHKTFHRDFPGLIQYNPGRYFATKGYKTIPSSFRYYYQSHIDSISNFSPLLEPFMIRDFEVTNQEYREFTNWVRDSIARTILHEKYPDAEWRLEPIEDTLTPLAEEYWPLNWDKKIPYGSFSSKKDTVNYREALEELYFPPHERYYRRRQINTKRLVHYSRQRNEVINVYPDTLSWIHDFSSPHLEPMTNMYFWHPAYDDYPVVSISHQQAVAYCDWLEVRMNKLLKLFGSPHFVDVSLPEPYHIEHVMTSLQAEDKPLSYPEFDLLLDNFKKLSLHTSEAKEANSAPSPDGNEFYEMALDNPMPLVAFKRKKKKTWFNSISSYDAYSHDSRSRCGNGPAFCLGNNVSEWTNLSFGRASRYFNKHKELCTDCYYTHKDSATWEKVGNDHHMVMGGNWYHQYPVLKHGKNTGAYLKRFESAEKARATLGFRYVVTLRTPLEQEDNVNTSLHSHLRRDLLQNLFDNWRLLDLNQMSTFFKEDTLKFVRSSLERAQLVFHDSGRCKLSPLIANSLTSNPEVVPNRKPKVTYIESKYGGMVGVIDGVFIQEHRHNKMVPCQFRVHIDQGLIKIRVPGICETTWRFAELSADSFTLIRLDFTDLLPDHSQE